MQKQQNAAKIFLYFALTFAPAVPLTLLGFILSTPEDTPMRLPASAVIFIIPAVVASLLVGRQGLRQLWAKTLDRHPRRHLVWYALSLIAMPTIGLLTYLLLPLFGVQPGPLEISLFALAALCIAYTMSALCEEIGWMGYAYDPMEQKWGALNASLVLGLAWALFHAVPWVQVHGWAWSLGWAVFSIVIRVPLTLLYVRTGRTLPAVVIAHASINVAVTLLPGFTDTLYAPYLFAGAGLIVSLCIVMSGTLRQSSPGRRIGASATKA